MSDDKDSSQSLGLAKVLHGLSNELLAARDATVKSGGGFGLMVQSAVVELDVAFTTERAGKADAGVRVWVLQAGVGGSLKRDETTGQRITLTLVPDDDLTAAQRRRPGPPSAEPARRRPGPVARARRGANR